MMRLVSLYRSDKGIWRYEAERDGKLYWSSLGTRNETAAIHRLANIVRGFEEVNAYESSRSRRDRA